MEGQEETPQPVRIRKPRPIMGTVELSDGSIIEIKTEIGTILRTHDPATGLPLYGVENSTFVRLVQAGPDTRIDVAQQSRKKAGGFFW